MCVCDTLADVDKCGCHPCREGRVSPAGGKGEASTLLMSVRILCGLPGGAEGEIPPPRSSLRFYFHLLVTGAEVVAAPSQVSPGWAVLCLAAPSSLPALDAAEKYYLTSHRSHYPNHFTVQQQHWRFLQLS